MSRPRLLILLLVLIGIAGAGWWIHLRNTQPVQVPFASVRRETLVSTLETNGKVEPLEFAVVRAERPGIIAKVDVEKGRQVRQGARLIELEARDARAEVASAEAAVAEAKAQLETVTKGGRSSEQVEIDNALARARLDLKTAQSTYESLDRLAQKQAATRQDATDARQRVAGLEEEIQALERKRAALVGQADRTAAEAKVRQAEAALEQVRARLERSDINAPISGVVYELGARVGAYLNVGDPVASVGNVQTLRVRLYVDEPELGRVAKGLPVTITWDALPGKQWKGTVETMPSQVVAFGTRQVGEVICTISNPGLELIPGTNVNAQIVSESVENGLTIPKEALRRENNQTGVYLLRDGRAEWTPVKTGASSVTRVAVLSGLPEGGLVALTTEKPLVNGQRVVPMNP